MKLLVLRFDVNITHKILAEALGLCECPPFVADRISIDSRNIKPGDIFIAINRGHEFVNDAITSGATLAIIDDKRYEVPGKTLAVDNTTKALKNIGNWVKAKTKLKNLIAITGSVGKTTTKFWLNSLLSHKYNSFCSSGNYNTRYGVSLSLCQLESSTDFGIFEIGSNHTGEIAELSEYLKPDIGVITNIFESHIGNFGDKQSLAREKISIVNGIKSGGILIFDGDSEFALNIQDEAGRKNLKAFAVGFSQNCDFEIIACRNVRAQTASIELKTPDGIVKYDLPFREKHLAYVSAMLVATIWAMKLPIAEFLSFMKDLSKIDGRGNVEKYVFHGKTIEVINDCYNASPTAVLASIENLQLLPNASKIAIIGQMKELGQYEVYYHTLVAEKLQSSHFEQVFFIGDKNLWDIMGAKEKTKCFQKLDNFVIEEILKMIQNDSIVLLKGSHSLELDKFIKYLKCSTT